MSRFLHSFWTAGGLAHREGIRQTYRSGEVGAARSATDLCSTLPCFGRRVRADPISLGARFGSYDGALLWCKQRIRSAAMIALASSRILELGARLWKVCRRSTRDAQVDNHRDARNACTSRIGGFPKKRLYSRLNWLGLSYPTAKAALAASSSSVSIFCRAVRSRSCF